VEHEAGPEQAAAARGVARRASCIVAGMKADRVLVIDDDENVRLLFARALKVEGYDVGTAATADEALSLMREARPSAIFLDLRMPFVNGAGFLYRLREDPAIRDIPVAVITGMTNLDPSTLADIKALGARVWFKPLSISEIGAVARTLLTKV
jgi:CheY-like chemotaxis protein